MFSVKFRGPLEDDLKQGQVKCNFETLDLVFLGQL